MDVSGELQTDVSHNVVKNRLDKNGIFINSTSINTLNFQQPTKVLPSDYCGSCYGAKEGCCNTCEDVINAYIANNWPIPNKRTFEQVFLIKFYMLLIRKISVKTQTIWMVLMRAVILLEE